MNNILFVLIDSIDKNFYLRYQDKLSNIHQKLVSKLNNIDILVVGHQDSLITDLKFSDSKSLYQYIAKNSQQRDVVICVAFAGLLSLVVPVDVVNYMRNNKYDVCLTENIPDGLVPMIISHEFLDDFWNFIEQDQVIQSSLKELIDWEYKGIDVGIYLSDSLLIMERIDFLPVNKGAIEYISDLMDNPKLSIHTIDNLLIEKSVMLRHNPQYIAIEISSQSDAFHSKSFSNKEMGIDLFRKIITEIDELCPETLISIGVWGDPFLHSSFTELFMLLNTISNKVLIECRSLCLNQEFTDLVLARPNTELIFDVSFTVESLFQQYKKNPHSLEQITNFIKSLPNKDNVWVRLTRCLETEESIKYFLIEWKDLKVLITKADSFGMDNKVVDLAPIKRHPCFALRRELTILNDGRVLLCRQANIIIGSLLEESLVSIWAKNQVSFDKHKKQEYKICDTCNNCDDWWIWN